jgi:hypothetical protein
MEQKDIEIYVNRPGLDVESIVIKLDDGTHAIITGDNLDISFGQE